MENNILDLSVKELNYLPDGYYLKMSGLEYVLFITRIVSEPGRRIVPDYIKELIDKVKKDPRNIGDKKVTYVNAGTLKTLCAYHEEESINIINDNIATLNNEINKGIIKSLKLNNADSKIINLISQVKDQEGINYILTIIKSSDINIELKQDYILFLKYHIKLSSIENSEELNTRLNNLLVNKK